MAASAGAAEDERMKRKLLYASTKKTRELYVLLFPHLKRHVSHTSRLIGEEKRNKEHISNLRTENVCFFVMDIL